MAAVGSFPGEWGEVAALRRGIAMVPGQVCADIGETPAGMADAVGNGIWSADAQWYAAQAVELQRAEGADDVGSIAGIDDHRDAVAGSIATCRTAECGRRVMAITILRKYSAGDGIQCVAYLSDIWTDSR